MHKALQGQGDGQCYIQSWQHLHAAPASCHHDEGCLVTIGTTLFKALIYLSRIEDHCFGHFGCWTAAATTVEGSTAEHLLWLGWLTHSLVACDNVASWLLHTWACMADWTDRACNGCRAYQTGKYKPLNVFAGSCHAPCTPQLLSPFEDCTQWSLGEPWTLTSICWLQAGRAC